MRLLRVCRPGRCSRCCSCRLWAFFRRKSPGTPRALFAVVALPIGLAVLNKLAARIAKKKRGPDARPLPAPSIFLLAQGLLHGACGYCFLTLSLGLTVRGLLPNAPEWNSEAFTADMAAVALSYVAGFVIVVAPGGLGVREFVLAAVLTTPFALILGGDAAPGMAVVVSLVSRLPVSLEHTIIQREQRTVTMHCIMNGRTCTE